MEKNNRYSTQMVAADEIQESLTVIESHFTQAAGVHCSHYVIHFILLRFDEDNDNPAMTSYQKQEMAPFLILARDAGAGALSCLAKNEANKDAMIAASAVPVLVRMVYQGTSFGRYEASVHPLSVRYISPHSDSLIVRL